MTDVITNRIQTNLLARSERKLLTLICKNLPAAVSPDHLTIFGVFGAVTVFAGYLLSWLHPGFLWLAISGFIMHWFGDSLDGSLARYRHIERPRYGYLLDHSADAFCNLIIMMGFGATQYTRLDIALLALCGYFMLCMYVFLINKLTNTFQLTFLAFGPTELRVGLICLTAGMYFFGQIGIQIGNQFLSAYDLVILFTACAFVTIFTTQGWKKIMQLRKEESGIIVAAQPASEKVYASVPPSTNSTVKALG